MRGRKDQNVDRGAKSKGQEIVDGLRELSDVLSSGEPLESTFTVRTYKIPPPSTIRAGDVRRVRNLLAMSQAAFAAFLGVDASTVRSWEQGLRSPRPLACRFISAIEGDPRYWRKRLAACLVGPNSRDRAAEAEATTRPRRTGRAVVKTR
jgi:DNA-binding transcriptional regulator YiaG